MIKTVDSLYSYGVPWHGNPLFHKELAYFATNNGLVLGVIIRDKVDNDYSWVLIAHKSVATPQFDNEITTTGYHLITMQVSRPTQAVATIELHAAMEKILA